MTCVRTAIVVGGGIGGLCAAIALRRRGVAATVYERAEELGDVGAGLVLAANAIRSLRRLGLGEAAVAAGAAVERAQIRREDGRVLAAIDMRREEARTGAPTIALHRAALHRVLRAALPAEAVRLGAECTGVESGESGVVARFADGREAHGDLLIGADGLRSAVRRQLFPGIEPRDAGYSAWRGAVASTDATALGITSETWGRGFRFGIVRVDEARIYWFATANSAPGRRLEPESRKRHLLERFGDWHAPIRALLEATPAEAILHNDIADLPPMPRWSAGRIALLGDAAHATTPNLGQGACMAIESAEVLAACLGENAAVEAALLAYERRRRPRTTFVTLQSRRIGRLAQWSNPFACELRNLLVRLLSGDKMERRLAEFLAADA